MQYIDILGPKGNAFALMGEAKNIAEQIGLEKDEINEILAEMKAGDYANLCDVFERNFGHIVQLRSEALDELEENYGYEDDYEDNDNWDMDGDALASRREGRCRGRGPGDLRGGLSGAEHVAGRGFFEVLASNHRDADDVQLAALQKHGAQVRDPGHA